MSYANLRYTLDPVRRNYRGGSALYRLLLALPLVWSASGCGSGGGGSETDPEYFRVLHAASDFDELEVIVDESRGDTSASRRIPGARSAQTFGALEYLQISDYRNIFEGTRTITVKRPGSVGPILTENQEITPNTNFTYVLLNEGGTLATALQVDDLDSPEDGKSKIRIANLAESQSSTDVYLFRTDSRLRDSDPAATALAFKSFSDYLETDAGRYEVRFTEAGTRKIVEDGGEIELREGQVATLVLFDKPGGGKPLRTELYDDDP